MSPKSRAKLQIFIVGTILAIPLFVVGTQAAMNFLASFNQGADPASIFRGHELIVPESDNARWLSDRYVLEHTASFAEREEIIAAYYDGWLALSRSYETRDTANLATYWAGAALAQARQSVMDESTHAQRHTAHKLQLTYFSEDSSVVAFEDLHFELTQILDGSLEITVNTSASVVMTNDSGYWRIRSLTLRYSASDDIAVWGG